MSTSIGGEPTNSELYRLVVRLREDVEKLKEEQQRLREQDLERATKTWHLLASAFLGPLVIGLVLLWARVRGSV
ncbi:hypothetical protein [Streptomyces sp. NPDC089799]|uniref:hypothetical protein n=1 Tax=Streptomyces sp. NPDC089799 TaxID=3155066 RepID=UPI00342C5306